MKMFRKKKVQHAPPIKFISRDVLHFDNENVNLGVDIQSYYTQEQAVRQLFADNGIEIKAQGYKARPRYIQFEYMCSNLAKLTKRKLTQILTQASWRLHKEVKHATSNTYDLAILIERDSVASVPFGAVFKNTANTIGSGSKCVVGLGDDGFVWLDVAEAPHVLIAGTTGSGKSVLLNSMLLSLMCQENPYTNKFLLIDPKQVELTAYEGSPSLLCPPIKDVTHAIAVLEKMCSVIDDRYRYLDAQGVKNIDELPSRLCRVYVVIDELADLMLTSKKQVESLIVRIAQLGRAAGIHLILATQRPTANVVTGLIKANIPTRIALTTASATDSVVILGHKGAESLLGAGDAILKRADSVDEIHFQAPYSTSDDVKKIVGYWRTAFMHADAPYYDIDTAITNLYGLVDV